MPKSGGYCVEKCDSSIALAVRNVIANVMRGHLSGLLSLLTGPPLSWGELTAYLSVWWEYVSERTGIDQQRLQIHAGTITRGLKRFEACGDNPFALAQIAGHSSITITQSYCHPQAETIERAIAKMSQIDGLVAEGGDSNIPALPEPPNTGTANH